MLTDYFIEVETVNSVSMHLTRAATGPLPPPGRPAAAPPIDLANAVGDFTMRLESFELTSGTGALNANRNPSDPTPLPGDGDPDVELMKFGDTIMGTPVAINSRLWFGTFFTVLVNGTDVKHGVSGTWNGPSRVGTGTFEGCPEALPSSACSF